jgi:hypothetical protein
MAFPAFSVPNIHFFQEKSVMAQHFLQDIGLQAPFFENA